MIASFFNEYFDRRSMQRSKKIADDAAIEFYRIVAEQRVAGLRLMEQRFRSPQS